MKKLIAIVMTFALVLALVGCGTSPDATSSAPETPKESGKANVYVLSGPTGIGALNLWNKAEKGETRNDYNFSLVSDNSKIVAAVSNGQADIAAVATNMASSLYNKTNGGVTVLAVNTSGVLSILGKDSSIKSISALAGKTIYAPGQGANPEYILRYVLSNNGVDPDKDVTINFVADGSELAPVWGKDPDAIIMAPQPVATSLKMNNADASTLFDMTKEWEKISGDNSLMMGCVIVRDEYLEKNPNTVKTFLGEYERSIKAAIADAVTAGVLCEKYGIIPKAALAAKAIPSCGLTYVDGEDMKNNLTNYLQVMFDANPQSIGGKMPGDDFFYVEK